MVDVDRKFFVLNRAESQPEPLFNRHEATSWMRARGWALRRAVEPSAWALRPVAGPCWPQPNAEQVHSRQSVKTLRSDALRLGVYQI